jgi:hypothetical protein
MRLLRPPACQPGMPRSRRHERHELGREHVGGVAAPVRGAVVAVEDPAEAIHGWAGDQVPHEPSRARQHANRLTSARPAPNARDGPGKAAAPLARNDRSFRSQGIVTGTGREAIPLATTTSVLLPAGVPGGSVNWVADLAPGAIDTEDQLLVRA